MKLDSSFRSASFRMTDQHVILRKGRPKNLNFEFLYIELRDNMECIIRDDAYLSSDILPTGWWTGVHCTPKCNSKWNNVFQIAKSEKWQKDLRYI